MFLDRVTEVEEVIAVDMVQVVAVAVLALLDLMLLLNIEEVPAGLEFNHLYQEQLPTTLAVVVAV